MHASAACSRGGVAASGVAAVLMMPAPAWLTERCYVEILTVRLGVLMMAAKTTKMVMATIWAMAMIFIPTMDRDDGDDVRQCRR